MEPLWAQVYITLLHQTLITWLRNEEALPLLIDSKCRVLLQQTSIIYWEIRQALACQVTPSVQRPTTPNQNNQLRNIHIPSVDGTTPLSPSVHSSITPQRPSLLIKPKCTVTYCTKPVLTNWEMRRPSPTDWCQVHIATTPNQYNLLRSEEALFLIEPKCTEPYYSKAV